MKQVIFYDKENNARHGGILTDDGDIICGCCGGLIPADEIGDDYDHCILVKFDDWVNIDKEISRLKSKDGLY